MPARPLETGLRLAAASVVLLLIASRFGNDIVAVLLPLFRWEIAAVEPQFRILSLDIVQTGADSIIRVDAAPANVVMVAGKLLPLAPQSRFHAATLAGHVLQPVILLLAILVAWPAGRRRDYLRRCALGAPLLVLLPMLDVPLVLAAELHSALLDIAAPRAFSAFAAWKSFLESGGRLLLGIVAGAAAVAVMAQPRNTHSSKGNASPAH